MTPKEKAQELIKKFINLNSVKLSDYSRIELPTAKQCALIAVEEILKEYWSHNTKRRDWWQEVKQEINNL